MRTVRVYQLVIEYPPGSDASGWVPAAWPEFLAGIKDGARRREARRRGFRWPREHLYLSSSGAYARASLLTWFGATVYVEASSPVTWPEWQDTSANGHDWEEGSTAARWLPPDTERHCPHPGTGCIGACCEDCTQSCCAPSEPDPVTGLDLLRPAPGAEPFKLSAADVRDAMAGIYAEGAWLK